MPSAFHLVSRALDAQAADVPHGSFATPQLRQQAFARLTAQWPGPAGPREVYFEDEQPDGLRCNRERWAVVDTDGSVRVDRHSLAELSTYIYAVLRDGGYVNPQRNRVLPAPGSAWSELRCGKLTEALWSLRDDLVQYPPPSAYWMVGPWGLPGVLPVVCGGHRRPATRDLVSHSIGLPRLAQLPVSGAACTA